jgi:cytoplasmic iron level regulating protein YaaA (DUF328/UPF0246 family)
MNLYLQGRAIHPFGRKKRKDGAHQMVQDKTVIDLASGEEAAFARSVKLKEGIILSGGD